MEGDKQFPWQSIWKVGVPLRLAFFIWCTALGKILTTNNFRMMGISIMDWCYMCKSEEESVAHSFLHCDFARQLWSLVFSLFGVNWVMPNLVVAMLYRWKGLFGKRSNSEVWKAMLLYLWWCIWRERNKIFLKERSNLWRKWSPFFY